MSQGTTAQKSALFNRVAPEAACTVPSLPKSPHYRGAGRAWVRAATSPSFAPISVCSL
jgi:hypothetical protein